jgi:nucleotide-binding universal stress UspA family protein
MSGGDLHAVISWHYPEAYDWAAATVEVDWADDAHHVLEGAVKENLEPEDANRVERHVVEGRAATVLLHEAADADLLVVGNRGHGAFTGMVMGSVSLHVIAHAPCPVVVVNGDRLPGPAQPVSHGPGADALVP